MFVHGCSLVTAESYSYQEKNVHGYADKCAQLYNLLHVYYNRLISMFRMLRLRWQASLMLDRRAGGRASCEGRIDGRAGALKMQDRKMQDMKMCLQHYSYSCAVLY